MKLENDILEINKLEIRFQKKYGIKLAVVADLHEREYGDILIELRRIKPTYILLPGDTLERHDEGYKGCTKADIDNWQQTSWMWKSMCCLLKLLGLNKKNDLFAQSGNGLAFIREVSQIAPVIMSLGNHEWYFTEEDYRVFQECNVCVLDNADISIKIDEKTIVFGGLSTRYNLSWLENFLKRDDEKILLCHHPEMIQKHQVEWNRAQLIISGHAHGGQIRLWKRGLFAPGQGLFPKLTKGLYDNLLVSSGVSNTAMVPRWGNPREIYVISI